MAQTTKRLAAAHVAGGEHLVDVGAVAADDVGAGLALPRASCSTPKASSTLATGLTKPIASSTRSAGSTCSLPGTSTILPSCHSTRTVFSALS